MKKEIKLKDHQIQTLLVDEIKKDPTNPNVMTLEQTNGLEKSMIKFGRLKYIVVDQDNVLIDGEHRLEIEKAIGTKEVQVIKVQIKDEIDRKIIRETLNQLHGEYDKQKQSNELASIFENKRLDELAELLAKPKEDLEKLITRYNPEIKFVKEEDESKLPSLFDQPAFVKKGEIWQLGRNRLMCGDCTHKDDVDKLMQENKADMVFTDPPYGVAYEQGKYTGIEVTKPFKPITNDNLPVDDHYLFIKNVFVNIHPYLNKGAALYSFAPAMPTSFSILKALLDVGYHVQSQIVWVKNQFILGRGDYHWQHEIIWYGYTDNPHFWCGDRTQSTVWEIDKDAHIFYQHPTQKPTALAIRAMKNSSMPDALILDPFLGSGSTLIACEQTNRVCYGMEIDEHYCSVIIKRWEEYTGQKAKKIIEENSKNGT